MLVIVNVFCLHISMIEKIKVCTEKQIRQRNRLNETISCSLLCGAVNVIMYPGFLWAKSSSIAGIIL